jgi:trk system potassium uptake protein TrkH
VARQRARVGGLPPDLATVLRDVGSLLLIEALVMTVSVGVALLAGELYPALAFLVAGGITASVGALARRRFADAPDPRMKHGMVIAAAGWFTVAVFGALPFLLTAHLTPVAVMATYAPASAAYDPVTVWGPATRSSLGYFRSPLHALFESMSGWTGSGMTMAVHEPSLPRAIQWWRSVIQWVGGIGVIVLTVSILARPGSGSYALYRSETRTERIHPSVVSTVRTIWKIFVGYTALAVVAFFLALRASEYGTTLTLGEQAWQALNHAMTGLSTGGFSVTDGSIATYNAPVIETVLLPIMTLGAIAFPVHYTVLQDGQYRELLGDLQTRWLFVLLGVGSAVLVVQNVLTLSAGAFGASVAAPLGLDRVAVDATRDSVFQFVSALTCTGFQSSPIGSWSAGGKLLLAVAMTIGGAAGSTVGGIKIIRAYTVARGIRWQFGRVFLPASAVVTVELGDRRLDRSQMEREFSEAAIISLLWVLLLAASSVVLVNAAPGFGYADALFEVASAQGNVGLSTGIVGPSMHPLAEAMFVLNMWVGRLEIIPVLVFGRALVKGLDP